MDINKKQNSEITFQKTGQRGTNFSNMYLQRISFDKSLEYFMPLLKWDKIYKVVDYLQKEFQMYCFKKWISTAKTYIMIPLRVYLGTLTPLYRPTTTALLGLPPRFFTARIVMQSWDKLLQIIDGTATIKSLKICIKFSSFKLMQNLHML